MDVITRLVNGDDSALEEIVEKYTNMLMRYCYGILCNHYDAQDAVQLTFIKFYEKRNSIRDTDSIKSYLFSIAYRTSIDIIRKRKLKLIPEIEEGMIMNDESKRDFPENIREAIIALKPKDRALFYSRAVEEQSYKELAAIYGKSEATLRKRYERVRKKLKSSLNNCHDSYELVKEEL